MLKNKGFSLIELMIVVLIIGVSTSLIVLTIDHSDDRLKSETQYLLAMIQLARDEAIITGQSFGLTIETSDDNAEYFFSRLEDQKWVRLSNKPYQTVILSDDIQMRSIISDSVAASLVNESEEPDLIYFLPTGETSEFQLWLNNKNTEYVLSSTMMGELSLKKAETL